MSTAPTSHHKPRRYRVPAAGARWRLRSDGSTRSVAGAGRALLLVAVAGCLVVLGAGCSRGSGASSFYSPTWTPPATPSASASANASATASLTPEQAAARATALAMEPPQPYTPEFSPEGAATAATYFLHLFPYVFATGDLDAWKNMSKDDCSYCNTVINNAGTLHDTGGWADPWEQEITALGYLVDDTDPNRYVIRVAVVSHSHMEHPGDGAAPHEVKISEGTFLLQLHWADDWIVEAVELEEEEDSK